MPSASLILLSLNLLLLFTIILGFLGGIIKGFYKSLFYLLFSIVFFVVGIIVIPYISEMLLNTNLSFLSGLIPDDANIEMTSIKETLPQIMANYAPDQAALFVPGSETMGLIFGIMKLVLNLVLFIVLLILNATLLKIIPLIIWLFIRPKKDPLTGDKPKKHRLLGGLVGAVKAFAALLLMAIPLAGISSIVIAAEPLYEVFSQEGPSPSANSEGIYTLAETEQDEVIQAGFEIMKTYKKSIIGSVYGLGDLDVKLFDRALKINVKSDEHNENIYLRRDIVKILKIAEIALKANDNSAEFDLAYLFKITEEDLTKIQKEIKGLSFLNVIKNVGFEIGYDYLVRENLIEGYEELVTLSTLQNINLNDEINTLIDVVIIISESENQEEIFENVFSLTKTEATLVFDKLSELQIIQIGLPLAVNFAFNMPETIQTMEENNINPEDLKRPTQEELLSDFKNMVNIYTLAKDMGFNQMSDFDNLNEEFVIEIEDIYIEDLISVVFDFSFLYKNDELFANLVYDFIADAVDEEFLEILSKEVLIENFNAGEIASIALLGKLFYTEALFSDEAEVDFIAVLRDENIEKIATYISGSNILSKGIEGFLGVFTADSEFVEIVVPENFNFKGTSGKTELTAILSSVRNIFEIGLTEEDFDFVSLSDEKIAELSANFSNSEIIRFNLSPIIIQIIEETEFDYITIDEDESFWTEEEIYYTFMSMKSLTTGEDFDSLSDDDIERLSINLSNSRTIKMNLSPILDQKIRDTGYDYITVDEDESFWTEEEIYYIFMSMKSIITEDDFGSISDEKIEELSTNFSNSQIIRKNLSPIINEKIGETNFDYITIDEDESFWTKDEIYYTFMSMKTLTTEEDFDSISNETIEELSFNFSQSRTIKKNLSPILNEKIGETEFDFITIDEEESFWTEDEIYYTFMSMKTLTAEDDFGSIADETVEELSINFSKSRIIKKNLSPILNQKIGETEFDYITVDEDESFWTEEEIYYTFMSMKTLTTEDDFGSIADETVEELSINFSKSRIIKKNLSPILNEKIGETEFDFITVDEEESFWTKDEIYYTFISMKTLTTEDDFGSISDDKIDELSINFSNSQIIKKNLSPILNQKIGETEFDFITSDEDESFWTEDEIKYTFKALKIFDNEDIDETKIHTIEDNKVLEISKSQTVSNAISKFLTVENEPHGKLDEKLEIPEGLVYYSTETERGEVYYFFVGIKEFLGDVEIDNFNVDMATVLDMDLEKIFESRILEATLVEKHLKVMPTEDNLGKYIVESYENGDEFDWYKNENPNNLKGDSLQLIDSLGMLDDFGITYGAMNYAAYLNVLDSDSLSAQKLNDAIITSAILNASLPKMLNELINTQGGLNLDIYPNYNKEDLDYWGEEGVNKELFYILDGLLIADEMKSYDYQSLDNTNKGAFITNAHKITKSETLIQMLPRILEESSLSMADSLRSDVDPQSLTEAEWNNEIEILVDIIVLLNENSTLSFDSPTPEHIIVVLEIKNLMENSLLYDASKITSV